MDEQEKLKFQRDHDEWWKYEYLPKLGSDIAYTGGYLEFHEWRNSKKRELQRQERLKPKSWFNKLIDR